MPATQLQPSTIHEAFRARARERPSAPALISQAGSMTYGELDAASDALASKLLCLGVQPGELVAVHPARSLGLAVGLLGILKAGAAYVPMDAAAPAERTARLARELGVRWGVGEGVSWRRAGLEVVEPFDGHRGPAPRISQDGTSLCYALFTSGSSGQPKAVLVEHRGVMRLLDAADYAGRTWLVAAPLGFDASTLEYWMPLCGGGRCALMPEGPLDAEVLAEIIREAGVTAACLPSALFELLAEERPEALGGFGCLLVGGDVLSPRAVGLALGRFPQLPLFNAYGPTENTVLATLHRVQAEDAGRLRVPIGRPVPGTTVHVLDDNLAPCPPGQTGQICLGGEGLARGYAGAPGPAQAAFFEHPRLGRLYATGDLGQWLEDGGLDFLGRKDAQVKVRGFRVEPAEVEAAARDFPGVREVLAMGLGPPGRRVLALFAAPGSLDARALRAHLVQRLPAHLIPSEIHVIERLPRTPGGKADRRALETLASPEPASPPTASSSSMERQVAGIWRDILGREAAADVGFFEAGGDSLKLARLQLRLASLAGVPVPAAEFFARPTIREQAAWIAGLRGAASLSSARERGRRQGQALGGVVRP